MIQLYISSVQSLSRVWLFATTWLQQARPPCPSPTPGVYPNSGPLSQWGHPTISSFVVPFSSWPQSFPVSGSFQMSQLFTSGDQSIGVSASTSLLPVKIQDWSPLGWTCWIQWIEHHKVGRVFKEKEKDLFYTLQECTDFCWVFGLFLWQNNGCNKKQNTGLSVEILTSIPKKWAGNHK